MISGVLSSAPASSLLLPEICRLTQHDPCWGVWNRGLAGGAVVPHHSGTLVARRAGRGRARSAGEGRGPYLTLGAAQRVLLPSGPVAQRRGHRVQKERKASLGRVFPVFSTALLGAQPKGSSLLLLPGDPGDTPGLGSALRWHVPAAGRGLGGAALCHWLALCHATLRGQRRLCPAVGGRLSWSRV